MKNQNKSRSEKLVNNLILITKNALNKMIEDYRTVYMEKSNIKNKNEKLVKLFEYLPVPTNN